MAPGVVSFMHLIYVHAPYCHLWSVSLYSIFPLYGEVNSIKNTTINIPLNDGVY